MGLQWASPRVPECGTQADCEGKSTYRFDPAVGVLVIDEQVDIEDEDDDAENNGDDDERKVEITPRGGGVLAALESNRIGEMEMGNQKLGPFKYIQEISITNTMPSEAAIVTHDPLLVYKQIIIRWENFPAQK
ncbi:hypothetical protein FF1_025434 [Malus domestica]